MSAPPNRTLAWALALARAGILVFPCKSHDRAPATKNGFKDATTNETQIRTWFGRNPSWNLAIRCGPQPCGLNLVVLDIDAQHGGLETWKAWEAAHTVPETVRHETPSSGFHLFLDAPEEFRPSANSFGVGIDIRGTDSYVVAPPSVAPSKITGELLPYRGHQELFLGDPGSVAAMPADIRAQLVAISSNGDRGVVVPLRRDHPSQFDRGDSVADLARVGWDWLVELPRDGWTFVRRDGGNTYWTRPGKDPRFGSSAVLHSQSSPDGGPLVTYSTALPVGGKPARGAAIGSFSPYDYIVTFRCGGDKSAAAHLIRGGPPVTGRAAAVAPDFDNTPRDTTSLFLPDSFWEATPLLTEIRDQSLTRLRTPDAVLAALLTMYATTVPAGVWLPGVVGAQAPLNMFAVVVGRTGGGKTSAMTIASKLLGDPGNADILLRKQLRSGEGLITLVNRPGRKGKDGNPDEPPSTRVGVHVHYDEGSALSSQTNQSTATIIPYLNTCWSGAGTVGGAKADSDAGFDASRVRICALIGVQYGIGANLFTGEAATLGFPQRLLFLSADGHPDIQSQEMPDEVIEPKALGLPFLQHSDYVSRPTFIELPRPIRQEIWDWSKQIPDPLDGHLMNLRLRVATVLMLLHGAGDTDFEPWWVLSNDILAIHHGVRHAFVSSIEKLIVERDVGMGRSLGRRQEAQYEYNFDRAVMSLMAKLGDKTLPTRAIKDHFKSWKKRYGFDHREVLDRAELLGLIVQNGGNWHKA